MQTEMAYTTGLQIGIQEKYHKIVIMATTTQPLTVKNHFLYGLTELGVGEYNYQSIASNGEVLNGTIVVIEHVEEDTGPSIGATFGSFDDDEVEDDESSEEDDKKQLLLLVAGSSAIASLLLIVLLLRRQ